MTLNPKALEALYEACKEFVRKCEAGEARSSRSYKQMKEAIAIAEYHDADSRPHKAA